MLAMGLWYRKLVRRSWDALLIFSLTDLAWSCDCPPPPSCHQVPCHSGKLSTKIQKWILFSLPLVLIIVVLLGTKLQIPRALNRPLQRHLWKEASKIEVGVVIFVISCSLSISGFMMASICYAFPTQAMRIVNILQDYIFPILLAILWVVGILIILRVKAILRTYEAYLESMINT